MFNLGPDALFHIVQVLGVDHAAEGIPGQLLKFPQIRAVENTEDGLVAVDQLLAAVGTVDEESAGHFVCEITELGGGFRQSSILCVLHGQQGFN